MAWQVIVKAGGAVGHDWAENVPVADVVHVTTFWRFDPVVEVSVTVHVMG